MKKYLNRELSWLSFNERVLQETEDETVPLLERLRFLGIFSSNLDEFYSVRVGTLKRMIASGQTPPTFFGGKPEKVLKEVVEKTRRLRDKFEVDLSRILDELRSENIMIVNEKELTREQKDYLDEYFADEVRPRLVPIMLENVEDFPYLHNLFIYLMIVLEDGNPAADRKYALIEVPADVIPRFHKIPGDSNRSYVIMLDDIIRYGLKSIFSIYEYDKISAYTIKMTRDSELDIETDLATSFFEQISRSLKTRGHGEPVRFVYDREMPEDLLQYIIKKNRLSPETLISGGRYHNARDMIAFPYLGPQYKKLRYDHPEPLDHPVLRDCRSILKAIGEQDVLLHYPYQSFHYIIDLLREAAIDEDVVSIQMTLYRVAEESQVVNALINAMRNGKKVTVVVELQARFDEEANIYWAEQLAEEGATIIHGTPDVKVHAKLILITRKKKRKVTRYACIGTGNFNESTAKIYADHSLLTSNPKLTNEVKQVFSIMQDKYKSYNYRYLLVSPFSMQKRLARLIKNEMQNAAEGREAYIYVKLNSFSQKKMINRIYKAAQAGVRVKMIVRGICCLLPGVEGLSENIEVISIVDKYLEHSRIFIFCNNNDPLVYISSADWMTRNLERRVEVGVPIFDENIKQELFDYMTIQFDDNVKARIVNSEQDNTERNSSGKKKIQAQNEIYKYLKNKLREPQSSKQVVKK